MSPGDDSPTQAALESLVERAENVIDYQSDTLSDIDDKAIRIYRANVLFISVLVAGFSITARTRGSMGQILNINVVAGMTLLIGSLAAGASKILSFPDRSGRRFFGLMGAILAVPLVATVLQGWLFRGSTEFVWILVPLYFLALTLIERATGLLNVRSYFAALSLLVFGSMIASVSPFDSPNPTMLHGVLPGSPTRLPGVVGPVDFALFVLVGSGLLLLDYRIYRANIRDD